MGNAALNDAESIGTVGVNEVSTVTVDATSGNWTLTFDGQTTGSIAFDAATSAVESAIEALSNVAADDITCTGGPGDEGGTTPYVITFAGSVAGATHTITVADVDLSGGGASVSIEETTAGVARAAGTARVPRGKMVVVQLDFDADAAGDVTIEGSLDGSGFDVLATSTAVASTTELVHLVDLPVNVLKVDPTAMTGGLCTMSYSEWRE